MTVFQDQDSATAAPVERKRLYRVFRAGEEAKASFWTWAAGPAEALGNLSKHIGYVAELTDSRRRKSGFRSQLRDLLERSCKSKDAIAIQEELRTLVKAQEEHEKARAQSRASAPTTSLASVAANPKASPAAFLVTTDVPDGPDATTDGDERQVLDDDPDCDGEVFAGNGAAPADAGLADEEILPPGGAFDDDDTDDFSAWKRSQ